MARSRAGLVGIGVAALALGFLAGCTSGGDEVSAGTTEASAAPARALSCAGGAVRGLSLSLASSTGQPTPEQAVARFTSFEREVPADGYSPAPGAATGTTQVPTLIYLHHSGQQADAELHLVSLDGTTWVVDSARYCSGGGAVETTQERSVPSTGEPSPTSAVDERLPPTTIPDPNVSTLRTEPVTLCFVDHGYDGRILEIRDAATGQVLASVTDGPIDLAPWRERCGFP